MYVYCDDSLLDSKKDWNCMKSTLFDVTSETSAIGYVREATGLSGTTVAMFDKATACGGVRCSMLLHRRLPSLIFFIVFDLKACTMFLPD